MKTGIYQDITELIGNTPLVRINKITKDFNCMVLAKLEMFNPCSSVKDRIALSMIKAAIKEGLIKKDTIIIEATSGNTGIGLAFVCAALGLKLTVVMPESMSVERRKILYTFGAQIILTPANLGMRGAVAHVQQLVEQEPQKYFWVKQFENINNPLIHEQTTAQEIWKDTEGKVDVIVCGVGTGGTAMGIAKALKPKKPSLKVIVVEPAKSPVLSGGAPGSHGIQGIGAGFVPKIFQKDVVDEIICVEDGEAYNMMLRLIKEEGLFVGISSGAAMSGVCKIAKRREYNNKTIVVILPDTAERYLSLDIFDPYFEVIK